MTHLDEKVLHVKDFSRAFAYVKPISIVIVSFKMLSLTSFVSVSLHFILHCGPILLPRHFLVQFLEEGEDFRMAIIIGSLAHCRGKPVSMMELLRAALPFLAHLADYFSHRIRILRL